MDHFRKINSQGFSRSALIFMMVWLVGASSANAAPAVEDDLLLMVIPSIAGAAQKPAPIIPPEWGVTMSVCCPSGNATWRATTGGVTKSTSASSCSAESTFNGFAESTAGSKSFSTSLTSNACSTVSLPFQFPFEDSTRYLFELGFNGSSFTLTVLSGPITASKAGNTAVTTAKEAKSAGMNKTLTIPLDLNSIDQSASSDSAWISTD